MPEPEQYERQLNEIEQLIDELPIEILKALLERHSYFVRLDAFHSVRTIFGSTLSCHARDLIVLSGIDVTDDAGKVQLPINRMICDQSAGVENGLDLALIGKPQFVATPIADAPRLLTVSFDVTEEETTGLLPVDRESSLISPFPPTLNVVVTVSSWNPDGSTSAKTRFSWICTIEAARMFSPGG